MGICLDDYHMGDREGRKVTKRTALDPEENNFDLMYEQVKALKEGKTVKKPIYNHVNGTLDEPETIEPTPIIIFEGLHPMHDARVADLLDFSLYIDTQKKDADLIIEVLPTKLDEEDKKTLRVRCIQKEGVPDFAPCYLFDEGSSIEWTPAPGKLASPAPGMKLGYYPEEYFGNDCQVLEMDGNFDNIQELVYVESALSQTKTKFYGEMTQAMLALAEAPGSNNGTGLMQTLAAFAIRDLYEKKSATAKATAKAATASA